MNTHEIRCALESLPTVNKGVFASDEIPVVWPRPVAYVFNCDKRNQPGSHWVAAYVDVLGRGTFFDSYGLEPYVEQHRRRLRENCGFYTWNTRQLQSDSSTLCGGFCLAFLFYMSHNNDFDLFCNIFEHNLDDNDKIIERFLSRIRKKHVVNTRCDYIQNCHARRAL